MADDVAQTHTTAKARVYYNRVGNFFVASLSMSSIFYFAGAVSYVLPAPIQASVLLLDLGSFMLIPAALALALCIFIVVFFMMKFSLRGLLCTSIFLATAVSLLQAESELPRLLACVILLMVAAYWMILWIEAFSPFNTAANTQKDLATNSLPYNPSKTSPTAAGPS